MDAASATALVQGNVQQQVTTTVLAQTLQAQNADAALLLKTLQAMDEMMASMGVGANINLLA